MDGCMDEGKEGRMRGIYIYIYKLGYSSLDMYASGSMGRIA